MGDQIGVLDSSDYGPESLIIDYCEIFFLVCRKVSYQRYELAATEVFNLFRDSALPIRPFEDYTDFFR